ncbi:MAG: hypothetical protein IT258_11985 [Saprospiraceae bacterium]|nr:hypothetical protein [Saprospiraceae bacterium]
MLHFTNGISFLGQISDRILFWTWLIMTPILIVKNFERRWARWYFGIIIISFVLSLLPMGIPFLTICAFAVETDVERRIGDYRLREGAKSVIAIPKITLIEEMGILEKEVGETDFYIDIAGDNFRLNDFDDIRLNEESDSVRLDFFLGNQSVMKKIKVDH